MNLIDRARIDSDFTAGVSEEAPRVRIEFQVYETHELGERLSMQSVSLSSGAHIIRVQSIGTATIWCMASVRKQPANHPHNSFPSLFSFQLHKLMV